MEKKNNYGGIGIAEALFLVFLTLKLTDNIDWSWWYVTLPLWGPIAAVFGIALILAIIYESKK